MKKIYNVVIFLIIVIILIALFVFKQNKNQTAITPAPQEQSSFDAKNSTFTINSEPITLINGISKTPAAPNSASINTTTYFGNEATGDLNGDGLEDAAFLVTQNSGGSGLFYYVVAALKTPTGYKTTNAFFIGDRIAPQSTEIHSDSKELHVNFAERKQGEPMTTKPSQGAVLLLKVTSEGVLEGLMK